MPVFDDEVICNQQFVSNQISIINNPQFTSIVTASSVSSIGGADPLPDAPAGYACFKINEKNFFVPYYEKAVSPKTQANTSALQTTQVLTNTNTPILPSIQLSTNTPEIEILQMDPKTQKDEKNQ